MEITFGSTWLGWIIIAVVGIVVVRALIKMSDKNKQVEGDTKNSEADVWDDTL